MKIYILFGCHSANDSWRTECLYICTHWDWLCASVTQTQLMVDFLVAGVMALSTDWLTHNFLQCGIQIPMWLAAWKTHLIFGVQCYTSVCVCMWMCMFVWYVCVCVHSLVSLSEGVCVDLCVLTAVWVYVHDIHPGQPYFCRPLPSRGLFGLLSLQSRYVTAWIGRGDSR